MSKPKAKDPRLTIQPGPGSSEGCPCCATLGLPNLQPAVPSDVLLQCCEPCIAALAFGQLHPHAVPLLHWHERDAVSRGDISELCPNDGLVTQSCVVEDHRNAELVDQGHAATHDAMVEGIGGLRCSGVWWTHHLGDEARARVDDLMPASSTETRVLEVRAGTLEHLEADHAMLIVAWCVASDPSLAPS